MNSTAITIADEKGGPPKHTLNLSQIASVDSSKGPARYLITIRMKGSSKSRGMRGEDFRAESKEDFERWATLLGGSLGGSGSSPVSGEPFATPELQSSAATDALSANATNHTNKQYAVFLSHYKREAGTEARLVQQNLSQLLRKYNNHVFLDSGEYFTAHSCYCTAEHV